MQLLHDALAPDVEVDADVGKKNFKLIYPWWASAAAKAEWRRLLALTPIASAQAMCDFPCGCCVFLLFLSTMCERCVQARLIVVVAVRR